MEKESYLLELSRYVVLNPARAGGVKDIGQWPWNSYSAMIGKSSRPEWLQTDWILGTVWEAGRCRLCVVTRLDPISASLFSTLPFYLSRLSTS
ncbi:hypothetical protein SAMN05421881_10188 [Nitrosomonas halophila]|uniref:Transposase n=1 Tax=Nitrosomonas halophila TaxID=44576 RepID=A0A1H3H2Y5_9PROT|nr:hypothetical protein SAMN05421881_10188 [Nitrosomonas halophila]